MSEAPLTTPLGAAYEHAGDADPSPDVLSVATARRQRVALSVLNRQGAATLDELAARVVARERGVDPGAAPEEALERAKIALHHNHVPRLADAGLVERDRRTEPATIRLAPALADSEAIELIERSFEEDDSGAALELLPGSPLRRHVVSRLLAADGPLPVRDLAESAAELDGEAPSRAAVDSALVSLHHVHLPKLDDAGIVAYDAEETLVSLESLPAGYESLLDV